ncbi:MAG: IS256 family transposase, partial [Clostridia bacterium]|nr:IS256 family transposase [Clostridia bacterium]
MAKKNEVPGRKELIKQLLASYEPKDAKDVQDLLKDMFKDTLQEMLNAELDNELGYSKYNYREKE